MPRKYFYIKYLCFCIKDNHRKNLSTSNCASECQLNSAKPREVKDNFYNFLESVVKARSIATFLLTKLGSRSDSAQGQILSETDTTPRGVTFY